MSSVSIRTDTTSVRAPAQRLQLPAASSPSAYTAAPLLASDFAALSTSFWTSILFWYFVDGRLSPVFYISLWPLIGLFLVAYAATGLYPGILINPVQELRRSTTSTSLVFGTLGAAMFLSREGEVYSRAVFILAWSQCLLYVPLFRNWTRSFCAKQPWWGLPTVVLGSSGGSESVLEALRSHPELGLRPVAVLDDRAERPQAIAGVPVAGGFDVAEAYAASRHVRCAIIAMPELRAARIRDILDRYRELFPRLIVVPEATGSSSLWVGAADLGGILGLEIQQRLLLPTPRLLKRFIDLSIALLGGLLVLPLVGLIAICIKATSRGPVLYGHRRCGRDGKPFTAWKFRSMVKDADSVLLRHLLTNPNLRKEWEQERKLRHDPRVTAVGRFLRKTSLDELPQLWNVLRNEMSLVGPRPIVQEEIAKYGDHFVLYRKVTPGLTGLWQVSGRNNADYNRRISFDMYYVNNWSVWLDLYILARTVGVVLHGSGAY